MKFFKSNILKFLIKLTVSSVLLFLIFRFIGLNKVLIEVQNANFFYLAIATFFVIFQILFKAIRWEAIINVLKKSIGIIPSSKYTLISLAFGFITPGRVGEFIKAKYLADKTGLGNLKSFMTVVVDKIYDIIALVLLGLIGACFLQDQIRHSEYIIFGLIASFILIVLGFIYLENFLKIIQKFIPQKYKESLKNFSIDRRFYVKSLFYSILIVVTYVIEAFFILKALGVGSPSIYGIMVVFPLMALSSMLPISIGGIGIREVVAISFFLLLGIPMEKSAIFSLMQVFLSSGIPAILGIFFYLNIKGSKKAKDNVRFK